MIVSDVDAIGLQMDGIGIERLLHHLVDMIVIVNATATGTEIAKGGIVFATVTLRSSVSLPQELPFSRSDFYSARSRS